MQKQSSYQREDIEDAFLEYTRLTQREFYDGDLTLEGGPQFDIHLEKLIEAPAAITRITSRSIMSYRRDRRHIRRNQAGFKVIWIVRSGSIKFTRSEGTLEIQRNEACIVNSDIPFKAQHTPDGDRPYEAFHIVIPPDIFFRHMSEVELYREPFSFDSPYGDAIDGLLNLILRNGRALARSTTQALCLTLLHAIADHLREGKFDLPQRQRVCEKRLSDIANFINMNITDPELTYEKVAESCGISSRYMSYLLKSHNTTFSELLWNSRLPKAAQWLESPSNDFSIYEIAYMSGFKNASHFSRKFKEFYGCSPREYRTRHKLVANAGEDGAVIGADA